MRDFPDVWHHVISTFDEDIEHMDILKLLFTPAIFTLFTSVLQDIHADHNAHIFDLFLLHGSDALMEVILQSVEQQRDAIKRIECDGEMQEFFRKGMYIKTFDTLTCCGIPESLNPCKASESSLKDA